MNITKIVITIAACAAITSVYAQRDDIRAFGRAWQTYLASPDRTDVTEVIAIYDELRPGNKQIADERMRTDLGVTIRDLRAMQLATKGPGDPAVRRQLEQALADVAAQKAALERAHKDTRALEAEIARLNELLKTVPVTPVTPPEKPIEPTIPSTPLKPPVKPVEPVQPVVPVEEETEFQRTFAALKNATSANLYQAGDSFVITTANLRPYATSMEVAQVATEINNMLTVVRNLARAPVSAFQELRLKQLAYWYIGYKNLTNGKTYPGVCNALKDHQDILGDLIEVCRAEMPTIPVTPIKPPIKPVEPVMTPKEMFDHALAKLEAATGPAIDSAGAEFVMAAKNYRQQTASPEIISLSAAVVSNRDTVQSWFVWNKEDVAKRLGYLYEAYKVFGRTLSGVCDALQAHKNIIKNFAAACGEEKPTVPDKPVTPIKPPVKPVEPGKTPQERLENALMALESDTTTADRKMLGEEFVNAATEYAKGSVAKTVVDKLMASFDRINAIKDIGTLAQKRIYRQDVIYLLIALSELNEKIDITQGQTTCALWEQKYPDIFSNKFSLCAEKYKY